MRTQIVLPAVFLCLLSVENLLAIQVTFRGRAACLTQDDPVIKHVGDDREPTSQTFAIVDQEFNVTGLPENEYWTHGGALGEYSWSISPVGGSGVIAEQSGIYEAPVTVYCPAFPQGVTSNAHNVSLPDAGEYVIALSANAYYFIGWYDEDGNPMEEGPFGVTIEALPNCSLTKNFTFYDIQLLTPAGDPEVSPNDWGEGQNEFTFNDSNPGVLTMNLLAEVIPASAMNYAVSEAGVDFEVDEINGSTLTWTLTDGEKITVDGNKFKATAVFTNLPSSNSAFGLKAAVLSWEGPLRSNAYEVFFPKNGTNHPACSSCTGCPNWFFYWSQTSANKATTNMIFENVSRSYYDNYRNKTIVIGTAGATESIEAWGYPMGIDCFAWVTAHENKHYLQDEFFWPTGYIETEDTDGDWLRDSMEATYMPGRPYDPQNPTTYPDTIGYGENPLRDCEDICMRSQTAPYNLDVLWTNGDADAEDWANPGKNSKESY